MIFQKSSGEIIFVPSEAQETLTVRQEERGKIVKRPTPEDVTISKEKEVDHTLGGVLKKHEVPKEEL